MIRAALYLRVSTEDQAAEGMTSIPDQEKRCGVFADQRGWQVVAVYREEGFTGTKADRPEWRRLMADAQQDRFERVVVLNAKRLARNAHAGLNMSAALGELGVGLAMVEGDLDTGTKEGRLLRTISLGIAEYDRDTIIEQMANGQRGKAARGGLVGSSVPYGWKQEGHGKNARRVIHEEEARVLRLVVGWMIDEPIGYAKAAIRLNEHGYRQRHGNPWRDDVLRDIVKNPALHGQFTWGGGRGASGKYGEPIVVQLDEQIISPERFEELQRALSVRKRPAKQRHKYPLSGGRFISACGQPYGGWHRQDRKTRSYRCKMRRWDPNGGPRCDCEHVPAQEIEDRVWQAVVDMFNEPGRLLGLATTYFEQQAETVQGKDWAAELPRIRAQIAKAEKSLTSTVIDYARQGLPAEAVKAATEAIQEDLASLKSREAQIKRWEAEMAQRNEQLATVEQLAQRVNGRLASADGELRAEVIRLLDVRVKVLENSKQPLVRIHGVVPVNSQALAGSSSGGQP